MSAEQLNEIIELLESLESDSSVPKNVKDRVKTTISVLKENSDIKIRVNKALHELDEVADDPNLESYTRTQVWNVVSLLEKIS
jgi:hypothetical protein